MSAQDWTTPQNAPDWINRTEKRLGALERREGSVSTILSITGPAQNSKAIRIADWNDPLAANNGYFWSHVDALHAPDAVRQWTGSVICRSDLSGMQEVWNTDDLNDVRYYMRTFTDDGTGSATGRTYSDWRSWATPSGLIELVDLGPTIDELLAEMAEDIDNAAQALLFYEQTSAPVPGVSGVPAEIPIGSVWVDTDDNRHTYSWDGDSWVSVQSTLFAAIDAELAIQSAAIDAAADAASDAMDFAESLTMVYRQASAPTNPDSNGRALVADDVWFDSDDDNRMYTWTGSWTLLGISTEDYAADAATAAQAAAIAAAAIDATTKAGAAQSAAIAAAAIDATAKAAAAQAAAIAVANTKNTIFRQNGIPTSLAIGDIWYDTDDSNRIYQAKMIGADAITAGEWEALLIGTTAIADDAITSAKIFAGTIVTTDLAATAIDGMTITGATIQTIVTAARGIKINSTGLTAYNGSGTPTLTIVGGTGAITMLGDLTSGSTITGAVVTGGTVQSEATSGRGVKMTSGGLILYAPSPTTAGTALITLNATTGSITLAGAMTGAGTITGPVMQSSAAALTGVKLSSTGFFAYDAANTLTLQIDATTGSIIMKGDLTSGSTITGAVLTGGTVQTEATTGRGIKMNSTGMILYAPSPTAASTPIFTLSAATGAVTMDGSIAAMTISGAIVTGGLLQTSATANVGIKIMSGGLEAYDGDENVTVFIDASTGVMSMQGGVLTGGSLTGGIVTGGTVQTSANAAEGIKINSAGFVSYDAVGAPTVTIDAATGEAIFKGAITSGSTIDGAALTIGSNIRLNSAEGLVVTLPGGGIIQFPTDGSDARMTAKIVAQSMTLQGDGAFYGTSVLSGTFKAGAGIQDPLLAPVFSRTYQLVTASGVVGQGLVVGGADDSSGNIITGRNILTSGPVRLSVSTINKTTGVAAVASLVDVAGSPFSQTVAMTRIGSSLYGLMLDGSDYKVWKATIVSTTSLTHVSTSTSVLATSATLGTPTLGNDGTNLLVAYTTTAGSGAVFIQPRDVTTFATTGSSRTVTLPDSGAVTLYYAGIGNFDYGASRTLVGYRSSLTSTVGHVATFNSSNVYQSTEHFTPNINIAPAGLMWDGTRFYYVESVVSTAPRLTKLPTGSLTPVAVFGRYTWYDGNATGSTHETAASPATASYSWPARAYVTLTASPAPQAATSGTDDANLIRMWIGTSSSTTKLQTSPAQGVVSQEYETISAAGGNAPTTTTFTGGTFGSGSFQSDNYVANTSGWQFKGLGEASLDGYRIDGGWTTYTATPTNLSIGNGTNVAAYKRIGKTIHFRILITFGSTTGISGQVTLALPFTSISTSHQLSHCLVGAGGGGAPFYGMGWIPGSSAVTYPHIPLSATNNTMTSLGTVGITMGTGSYISVEGTYEMA